MRQVRRPAGTRVVPVIALILALLTAGQGAAQTPPPDGFQITRVDPTGSVYRTPSGAVSVSLLSMRSSGSVVGTSLRYSAAGADRGQDAWLFSGGLTRVLTPTGGNYEWLNAGTSHRTSHVYGLNENGQAIGTVQRVTSMGAFRGRDAWFFDGTSTNVIGLSGGVYEWLNAGVVQRDSAAYHLASDGKVLGFSNRYSSTGASRGSDAWLYSAGAAQHLGLSGSAYEWNNIGTVHRTSGGYIAMNTAAQVVGSQDRYSTSGQLRGRDLWVYSAGSIERIGLEGPGYEWNNAGTIVRHGDSPRINNLGQVTGTSIRYTSTGGNRGIDVWIRDNGAYQVLNPTGAAYEWENAGVVHRSSASLGIDDAGRVWGYTSRFSPTGQSRGQDAWLYHAGSTQFVGLTGGDYEWDDLGTINRTISFASLSDNGKAVGGSRRFAPSGSPRGLDLWFFDGSTTRAIGPAGGVYEWLNGDTLSRSSEFTAINASLLVAGAAERYTPAGASLGKAAWVYSPITNDTTVVIPSINPVTQEAYSKITVVSDGGAALGEYDAFDAAGLNLGRRAFWWSMDTGAIDLGSLVNGGLSNAGWQWLSTVAGRNLAFDFVPGAVGTAAGGGPEFILGQGRMIGESSDGAVFLLNAIPSPAAHLVLLASLLTTTQRRRYRAADGD